jgi:hypothetical protein
METMNIELDFTDVNAAGGLGTLPAGLHDGSLVEFKHFPDTNRLYAYMVTNGIRHRESFGLDNPNSLPFVKAFLLSAGVPESKLGGKGKVPFHKLEGRSVYFQYTPADTDESGKRREGSYARYVFYPKTQWDQMAAYANASDSDIVIESNESNGVKAAPTNGVAKEEPKAAKAAPSKDDDANYDFLLDDE